MYESDIAAFPLRPRTDHNPPGRREAIVTAVLSMIVAGYAAAVILRAVMAYGG